MPRRRGASVEPKTLCKWPQSCHPGSAAQVSRRLIMALRLAASPLSVTPLEQDAETRNGHGRSLLHRSQTHARIRPASAWPTWRGEALSVICTTASFV